MPTETYIIDSRINVLSIRMPTFRGMKRQLLTFNLYISKLLYPEVFEADSSKS